MLRKYILISIALVTITIILIFSIKKSPGKSENQLTIKAQKGPFKVLVYSTGQLESEKSDNIYIPEEMKDNRTQIHQLTITDIIDEGTYVDSGEYIATLDHQAVEEQLKTSQDELDKLLSEYEDSKIDSNLTLSNQRDLIINAKLDLEEKSIIIEESVYEAPSIQKKAEMDYSKTKRKLEQVTIAYGLKQQQEINKVARKFINYKQVRERAEVLEKLYDALIVTSPKTGIISYFKYPFGGSVQAGSRVSQWSPIIATFPNMDNLISLTYINEIDISKIKKGQKVTIGIDAFPDKQLVGEVINIANVGQLMPKSDAKVFEVKIRVSGSDYELKPSMTTSNVIQANYYEDVLFVPIESVFKNDSMSYVYLPEKKMTKQIIETGTENENYIVVKQGINEGDILSLTEPDNASSIPFSGIEIYEQIKQKERVEQEDKERLEQETKKKKQIGQSPASKVNIVKSSN